MHKKKCPSRSKLTWSLEVFELGPLSFPFSACKPRHTALNVRTVSLLSGNATQQTCWGARSGCRHCSQGCWKPPSLQGQSFSTSKTFACSLRSTCPSSSLERIWFFQKKSNTVSLFVAYPIERLCPSGHLGDAVTRYLLFS